MKKKILALICAAFTALSAAGCGSTAQPIEPAPDMKTETEASAEEKALIKPTDSGLVASFDNTEAGCGGGSGIEIGDGEYLAVETELTAGKVQVKAVRGGDDITAPPIDDTAAPPTINHEFDGTGTTEYGEIAPGNYMIFVNVTENATGKINFIIKSSESEEAATVIK